MAARTEACTVIRIVSDCSPVAIVMTGWRDRCGAIALARRTRASGVTPSERARICASGDFGFDTGRRRPCTATRASSISRAEMPSARSRLSPSVS